MLLPRRLSLAVPLFGLSALTLFYFWSYPTASFSSLVSDHSGAGVDRVVDQLIHTPSSPVSPAHPSLRPRKPKITIIAIWNPKDAPSVYLPNYFASVAANPSIEVLFIKYDKYEVGCDTLLAPGVHNVREVCLSKDEYWSLHADYLCQYWKCSNSDRERVLRELHRRSGGDHVNSFFRPLRAGVFAQWVDRDVPIWGWCDMDEMLGNFERNFPWDVAGQFDVLVPAYASYGEELLLFLPGHLAFFRNSKRVLDEYMKYPALRTLNAYFTEPEVCEAAEEVEYSHYTFTNPRLTFLRFHALVNTRYHISSPNAGVYAIENDRLFQSPLGERESKDASALESTSSSTDATNSRHTLTALLSLRNKSFRRRDHPATFTEKGIEYNVELREAKFESWLWFPRRFAVDFRPDYNVMPRWVGRRFTMRRAINGPVTDRWEPDDSDVIVLPPDVDIYENENSESSHQNRGEGGAVKYDRHNRPFMVEGLYNHFQGEKYAPWWALPERSIKPTDILFMDREQGAQVWDPSGRVLFHTSVMPSSKTEG